jgi:DNA-binding response OmpR family regulator
MKILLVDDNEDQTATLAVLLQVSGHQVETAGNGQSGIELARSFRPDVAILDIGLPDMDGYELARKLRSDPICVAST